MANRDAAFVQKINLSVVTVWPKDDAQRIVVVELTKTHFAASNSSGVAPLRVATTVGTSSLI